MLLFTWSLFFLCLSYTTDGLLNTISASDKIIMELQRNMTKLQQQTEKTVLDQNRKILEMNNTIETQQRMITSLTAQVKEQNTTISTLRMNETFSAYQLILRDVVDRQNQHVNQTYNQIGVLDKTVSDLGKQFHYLSLSILDAEKKTSLLNTSLQESMKNIAFTVALNHNGPQPDKKVMYDLILLNIGNGYSAQSGVFTCPRDGEYVFTWSTMGGSESQDCYSFIYRNGVVGLQTHSYEAGGSYHEVASNTAVFHLIIGDSVWIETRSCVYFYGYPYTAFSGWRL